MTLAELKQRTSERPVHGFSGLWHTIEWQPDLFTPQKFVVGVMIETSTERGAKLMDGLHRLECFFKPATIAQEFNWLMASARRALAENGTPLSPNLTISEGLFIQGASLQEKLDKLFDEIVVAARPIQEGQRSESVGPDTETVRKTVADELKRIMGLRYEQVAREKGETLSNHHLDVPLAPTRGAASIISACYRSITSIETRLLRASNDINAYAAAMKKPQKAIFMQVPDAMAPLSAKERRDIERLTGEESWKLECAGFSVPRHERVIDLAKEIDQWATPLI